MASRKLLDPIHPGEILSEEFLKPMGISKLARDIGVSPAAIVPYRIATSEVSP